jgi:TRAP-type mannitol/chloroaromatic compound transport system substrate-binding protein
MQRRSLLQAATVGAALAAPTVVRAQGLPQVRWRLASSWPKSLDTIYGGADVVARRVSAATGGRFEISVHGPGELVPAFQVADAVQQGTVECAHTASVFFFGKDPTFAFDGSLPFGMTSRQQTGWMYDGGGLALMRDFYKEYGIINFPCGNTGAQMAGWFRREIRSVNDLKGLKFRSGGFGGVVWQAIGAVAQSIPGGEIYTALEKGTIDGAEFVGPYDDEKLGFQKVAKFYYYPSFVEPCGQITMYVGAKAWEALPREYQQIFEMACSHAHVDMQAKYDTRNPDALRRLVGTGTQLRPFPREVGAIAFKATEEIYADLSSKNAKWKKVFDSFMKYRDDQILWSRFSENGFESMMASLRR